MYDGAPRSLTSLLSTSITRADRYAASDIDGQALPGVLVDHGQAFDLLPVGASVEDEVVGPDAVRDPRVRQSNAQVFDFMERRRNAFLQQRELMGGDGLFDLQSGEHAGLLGVDGGDPASRKDKLREWPSPSGEEPMRKSRFTEEQMGAMVR